MRKRHNVGVCVLSYILPYKTKAKHTNVKCNTCRMETTWPISAAHSASFIKMAKDGGRGENRREAVDAVPRGAGCHLGVREN